MEVEEGQTNVSSMSSTNNICEDNLSKEQQESFECPVCKDMLADTYVYGCGHSVCGGCYHQISKGRCPICKWNGQANKNYVLNDMIERFCPAVNSQRKTVFQNDQILLNYSLSERAVQIRLMIEEYMLEHIISTLSELNDQLVGQTVVLELPVYRATPISKILKKKKNQTPKFHTCDTLITEEEILYVLQHANRPLWITVGNFIVIHLGNIYDCPDISMDCDNQDKLMNTVLKKCKDGTPEKQFMLSLILFTYASTGADKRLNWSDFYQCWPNINRNTIELNYDKLTELIRTLSEVELTKSKQKRKACREVGSDYESDMSD